MWPSDPPICDTSRRSVETLTAPEMRSAMWVLRGDGLKGGVRPESLSGVDKGRAESIVPGAGRGVESLVVAEV